MDKNKTSPVTAEEIAAGATGNIPHWMEEVVNRQRRYLQNYQVVGGHTQVNYKRIPKEGQKPVEVHGSRIGAQFSRRITGAGQPFHGDLIPGQLRLIKLYRDRTKYNQDGSFKQLQIA